MSKRLLKVMPKSNQDQRLSMGEIENEANLVWEMEAHVLE
jgi:hypothetical protein